MCGLVGIAGTINDTDKRAFKDLLWVNAIRGRDGTGVASVPFAHKKLMAVSKVAGDPKELFDRKSFDAIVTSTGKCLFLGHSRLRTIGDVNIKNTHPFLFENIVGAHNGTLQYRSRDSMKWSKSFDTDSEALFNNLNEDGLQDTIDKMEGIGNAYALTWYDKRDETINFIRNSERPLFYTMSENKRTIYWASDASMLYLVLNMMKIKFPRVFNLQEHIHTRWKIPDKENEEFGKQVRKECKPRPKPIGQYGGKHTPHRVFGSCGPTATRVHQFDSEDHLIGYIYNGQAFKWSSEKGDYVRADAGLGDEGVEYTRDELLSSTGRIITFAPKHKKEAQQKDLLQEQVQEHTEIQKRTVKQMVKELDEKGKLRLSCLITPYNKEVAPYYLTSHSSGELITENVWEEKTKRGCCNCTDQPEFGEPVKWLENGDYICAICMSTDLESLVEMMGSYF
jgi:predicted glutamine amidotransferase